MCLEVQVVPTRPFIHLGASFLRRPVAFPRALRSQVALDDYDLDALELGGLLTWEEPEDLTQVINYVAWRKSNPGGHEKKDPIKKGVNQTKNANAAWFAS